MNGSVLFTILLIFWQRANAAQFSTNTFVTFQKDSQLNTLAIEEFDISGSLIQKISLPSNYQAPSGPRKLQLDASSSILAVSAQEGVSNTKFCHVLNANAQTADITTFNSGVSVDCIVEGQDVWLNYQSGIAYGTRGSSLVSTSTSIVSGISQILSMEKEGTKLFVADAAGTLYSGDPIVKSGTMSMTTVLSSPAAAAFYIHNQNTLYTISGSRPISRFTLDSSGTVATNVWTWTPSNLSYLPRAIIAMDVAGKTYIFVAYFFNDNGTYKHFVQRFIDDGTTLTNPLIIVQPMVDEIFSISPSPIASCTDNLVDQDETDVDCGGSKCSKCINDKKCLINADCSSGYCNANKLCKTPTCTDLVKNQDETDVDCGGAICTTKCATGKQCTINGDCVGGLCTAGTCAPTCSDTVKNQDESDVDCGGTNCQKCGNNRLCVKNSDCFSTFCNPVTTKCANPTCSDTFKNQDETDIDCGGAICTTKCAIGKKCTINGDCVGGLCTAGTCAPTCSDNIKNQDESDVDCGGTKCQACSNNKSCLKGSDCTSSFCNPVTTKCATPTCLDTFKNQDETDIDCGGATCTTKCVTGKQCQSNGDCVGGLCTAGMCAPTCSDTVKNQDESDVDCGGTKCQACSNNKSCLSGSDCTSLFCNPVTTKCATPTCSDTFKNQDETDVDCGGATCTTKCVTGKQCQINGDCVGGLCTAGTCAPTCSDNIKNQDETDIDCGGTKCQACGNNKSCLGGSDCTSSFCNPVTTKCATPTCLDSIKNQDETDVDCGGQTCAGCDINKVCVLNSDCKSNNCASDLCASAPVAVPQAPVTAPMATPQAPIAGPVSSPMATPVDVPIASPQATPTDAPVNQPNAEVPVSQPINQSPQSDTSPQSSSPSDQPTNVPSTSAPVVFQISNAVAARVSAVGLVSVLFVQILF